MRSVLINTCPHANDCSKTLDSVLIRSTIYCLINQLQREVEYKFKTRLNNEILSMLPLIRTQLEASPREPTLIYTRQAAVHT